MRFLSLFSGIEAASAAWNQLGWKCVAVAETEKFPSAVLAHHYPDVPNLGDITKITETQIRELGHIDVVIGGFPCQDVSVAGKRAGLKHADGTATRSGLFYDAIRIARWAKSRFVVIENVPGLFNNHCGRDFACVVGELAGCEFSVPPDGWGNCGAAVGPHGLVEWSVLDAQFWGLAQRRKRVFLVLDTGDWRGRPPILLESASLRGDPAPRREAGKGTAPTISSRPTGGGGLGTDFDCDGGLIGAMRESGQGYWMEDEVAGTIDANMGMSGHANRAAVIAHALRAEGFDASEDGTGRGIPLIANRLTARMHKGVNTTMDEGQTMIQVAFAQNTRDEVRLQGGDGQIVGSLAAEPGMKQSTYVAFDTTQITSKANYSEPKLGDPCHPLAAGGHPSAVAFDARQSDVIQYGDKTGPLDTEGSSIGIGSAVRRLTPRECARLQGFPDSYLDIIYRGKPAADGPKYKALGNSMAVPVMAWIGRRIAMVETVTPPLST